MKEKLFKKTPSLIISARNYDSMETIENYLLMNLKNKEDSFFRENNFTSFYKSKINILI